jgi:hypothetical protein
VHPPSGSRHSDGASCEVAGAMLRRLAIRIAARIVTA